MFSPIRPPYGLGDPPRLTRHVFLLAKNLKFHNAILKVSFCREINLKQKGKFIENIGNRKNVFCLDEFTLLFFGDFNSVHLNQIFLDEFKPDFLHEFKPNIFRRI